MDHVIVEQGVCKGVVLQNGEEVRAKVVVANADPFRLQELVGRDHWPQEFNDRVDGMKRNGTTLKVRLASACPGALVRQILLVLLPRLPG